jgi:NAD(P)H-hydrate epimerase
MERGEKMDKYVSVEEMISIEKASDSAGHSYPKMMAFAGRSLAENIVFAYSHLPTPKILGLVGAGNNGGDTLVAMVHLLQLGWDCCAYLVKQRTKDPLLADFTKNGGMVVPLKEDESYRQLRKLTLESDIVLDGVLGTGIQLPLRPPVPSVLDVVRISISQSGSPPFVVAVDCPSGVDSDTGNVSEYTLHADLTVCMAAVKKGLLMLPAFEYLGRLVVGDIGLPKGLQEWQQINRIVLGDWVGEEWFTKRPLDGHKGTFGTVQVIAGSKNYTGAVLLAGRAAFRSGAGWVNLCVPEFLHPYLTSGFPEATWLQVPCDDNGFYGESASYILKNINKADAILVGPGLGQEPGVRDFMQAFVNNDLPTMVIDADGLKLLTQAIGWWEKVPQGSILTPHPGEMSIMTGKSVEEIQADRVKITEKYSKTWNQVVVLKGAFTVVSDPEGNTAILPVATPALGRAGTGDVLAGMIAGFKGQGMNPFQAACAGVWYHARAGLLAAEMLGSTAGVLAGDLIDILPGLLPY